MLLAAASSLIKQLQYSHIHETDKYIFVHLFLFFVCSQEINGFISGYILHGLLDTEYEHTSYLRWERMCEKLVVFWIDFYNTIKIIVRQSDELWILLTSIKQEKLEYDRNPW